MRILLGDRAAESSAVDVRWPCHQHKQVQDVRREQMCPPCRLIMLQVLWNSRSRRKERLPATVRARTSGECSLIRDAALSIERLADTRIHRRAGGRPRTLPDTWTPDVAGQRCASEAKKSVKLIYRKSSTALQSCALCG